MAKPIQAMVAAFVAITSGMLPSFATATYSYAVLAANAMVDSLTPLWTGKLHAHTN